MDGISEQLRDFIALAPRARESHVAFLRRAEADTPNGAAVLDVGSGLAPYREFFAHTRYTTCDWEHSIYEPELPPDIIAPADRIPVSDASFDAVLCTQVLEHVPEPWVVLPEFHRVLRPGGKVWITAPFVWYLHEQPYDYYRYTAHGLRYLLERAGFCDVEIVPLHDSFTTLAQLVGDLGFQIGRNPNDGYDPQREIIAETMHHVATLIGAFANFDTQRMLPIDYAAVATRPRGD